MNNAYFDFAEPKNEPVLSYAPGSHERKMLQAALAELKGQVRDIPMYIDGREERGEVTREIRAPHEHAHLLGKFHVSNEENVHDAIDAALSVRETWAAMSWNTERRFF